MTDRVLRIGLVGCGPIAQFAHIPTLDRTKFVKLSAICEGAEDLLVTMGKRTGVDKLYTDYTEFLKDTEIEAVVVAVSDIFHVSLATMALEAGKHVLVEKPLGTNTAECLELCKVVEKTGLTLQVGSMKRHDPGMDFAHRFVKERMGWLISVSGWYRDTRFRSAMQAALLPSLLASDAAIKSPIDLKATDKEKYSLVTHGAHLLDNLRYLGGDVTTVTVKAARKHGQYSWHGLMEFEHGGVGHFELTVKVNSDWSEGYVLYGEGGSVEIKTFLPFYNRSSEVKAFDAEQQQWHTPLGADSNPYKRQLEHFARCVLENEKPNPDCYEGLATVRLLDAVYASATEDRRVEVVRD